MQATTETRRLAVVGAGIAGLYSAWRLAHAAPNVKITVFEQTERLGGRLHSTHLAGAVSPVELGAFSFSESDENVAGLCRRLGLARTEIDFRLGAHFLRGRHIEDGAIADPGQELYRLQENERGTDGRGLILAAVKKIAPALQTMWPFVEGCDAASIIATHAFLRAHAFEGRPLWAWGWWNLLDRVLSHEAYALIAATFGSAAALGNVNAYDAIATLLWEARPGQRHFKLREGNQELARELARRCAGKVEFKFGHALQRVRSAKGVFELDFTTEGRAGSAAADSLILAIPQKALMSVTFDAALGLPGLAADFNAVCPIGAVKLFIAGRLANASASAHGEARKEVEIVTASMTDIPLRQCYWHENATHAGAGLAMASFADDAAGAFWSALGEAGVAGDACDESGLVAAARRQLGAVWNEDRLAPPYDSAFADWSQPPFGAAWHAWRPGVKSWQASARIRQPNPSLALYVCGEAFAQLQGWTEGAINNAEMMLERHFGVGRPEWVRADYPFEI